MVWLWLPGPTLATAYMLNSGSRNAALFEAANQSCPVNRTTGICPLGSASIAR